MTFELRQWTPPLIYNDGSTERTQANNPPTYSCSPKLIVDQTLINRRFSCSLMTIKGI